MILTATVVQRWLPLAVLASVNLLSFVLFGIDKSIAVRQGNVRRRRGSSGDEDKYAKDWTQAYRKAHVPASRIPEAALLSVSALFGALGGTLGMYLFRHKTKKKKFLLVPVMFAAQTAIIVWLVSRGII